MHLASARSDTISYRQQELFEPWLVKMIVMGNLRFYSVLYMSQLMRKGTLALCGLRSFKAHAQTLNRDRSVGLLYCKSEQQRL